LFSSSYKTTHQQYVDCNKEGSIDYNVSVQTVFCLKEGSIDYNVSVQTDFVLKKSWIFLFSKSLLSIFLSMSSIVYECFCHIDFLSVYILSNWLFVCIASFSSRFEALISINVSPLIHCTHLHPMYSISQWWCLCSILKI